MLREVGGKRVADGNLAERVKTQKAIIRDHLEGAHDRPKVEGWTPRWMAFPPTAYTKRPFAPAARARSVAPLLRRVRPPAEPAAIAAE
jgi:ParB family chromosome partitioning protein